MSDWINAVAESDLLPGQHTVVEVEDAAILLVNLDGQYYAIEDVCTHDGSEISTGCIIDGSFECPRHGARFDIKTGEVTPQPMSRLILFQYKSSQGLSRSAMTAGIN